MEGGRFDTIFINSVAQYFPGVDYLLHFLVAFGRPAPRDGAISVVTCAAMLCEIELQKAAGELQARLKKRLDEEPELVLDHNLFLSFRERLPEVDDMQIELEHGRLPMMSRLRYEV